MEACPICEKDFATCPHSLFEVDAEAQKSILEKYVIAIVVNDIKQKGKIAQALEENDNRS